MTEVLFNGHAGRLEGRYHQSDNWKDVIIKAITPMPRLLLFCTRIRNMAEL